MEQGRAKLEVLPKAMPLATWPGVRFNVPTGQEGQGGQDCRDTQGVRGPVWGCPWCGFTAGVGVLHSYTAPLYRKGWCGIPSCVWEGPYTVLGGCVNPPRVRR